MSVSQTGRKIAILAAAFVLLISATAATNAYASSGFNKQDFKIKSFGIRDNNPFLKVEGTAGGTKPSSHNTIYGYVFKTDKGIFAVVSHFNKDSKEQSGPKDLDYHAHKVTLDKNNCVSSINDKGVAHLSGDTVKVLDTDANKVKSVLTAKLTVENNHHICVDKVFDSQS
jgi:hypothetical protein